MPGALTHLYIARQVVKFATPEFLLANCFPDIEHLVYGGEKIERVLRGGKYHLWGKKMIDQFPEFKEGIKLHMEVDKIMHCKYIELKSAEIGKKLKINPIIVHSIFETCIEICLARKKPWLRRMYKQALKQVDLKEVSSRLAILFKKEGAYMDKALSDAQNLVLAKDYSAILKLFKIKKIVTKYIKKAPKVSKLQYVRIISACMHEAKKSCIAAIEETIAEVNN